MWHVESRSYDGISLEGTTVGQFSLYPEAIHLGNGMVFDIIDKKLSPEQRRAVETILTEVEPFNVFHDLPTSFLGFQYKPMELHRDGIRSRLKIPGSLDLKLDAMKNPVTGDDELAILTKPTGPTANVSELRNAETFIFEVGGKS
ncbi:MAG: hypothetical protein CL696_04290 [Chloroflexi bacterium]|jgi:hypothetical protein|nr:hypothetical protein [Chloroflexota bacterium]MQG55607.1 DUF1326 domain-containing protein [SAR202 cluster bacterium]